MFVCAAKAVAEQVSQLDSGLIYPPQSQILETSLYVAVKVAAWIFDQDLARISRPVDIEAHVRERAYRPEYPTYVVSRPILCNHPEKNMTSSCWAAAKPASILPGPWPNRACERSLLSENT
jgi:hypothetical protein